ncbi:uncharacterized protein M421DRAFT_342431 [Didymella exigua CBS 183.55]|uniref:Uncharacterized protein n=1 Tax=Didymella exigua CBS 183.55 TaxID=1150837 RepID=A0A6A5RW67_9PLEO|nr:uncharacterized protein M421DRAFT_342431 [Didymella exigua CBS 183.55]KAF1931238.1 hypothetical protein M421DRAFT_342431 [Didymella exigua CBS 183.55]
MDRYYFEVESEFYTAGVEIIPKRGKNWLASLGAILEASCCGMKGKCINECILLCCVLVLLVYLLSKARCGVYFDDVFVMQLR